jgi:hypothetical protein
VTLRIASDLAVVILSAIALAAGRPAFQRWKSAVRHRADIVPDAELEPFLRSRSVKVFQVAWCAIVASLLCIAVWDLLTQL